MSRQRKKKKNRQPEEERSSSAAPLSAWKVLACAGLIAAAGMLTYFNSLKGALVLDDEGHIVRNLHIRRLWPPWESMFGAPHGTRPVSAFSLAVNYAISGLEPWSYHVFNVLVHILASLTLFGIVRRTLLGERLRSRFAEHATALALAVALLWMLHPLQTQAVTYIVQRDESLMGFFYLLTLYCVIRGAAATRGFTWHAAAVAACALGMGCKQVMITAPLVVLLYDVIFLSRVALRQRWYLYAALAATWMIIAALQAYAPHDLSAGFNGTHTTPFGYATSQLGVLLHYLRLAVWPDALCIDYAWPAASQWSQILPGLLAVGALLAATAWALLRRPAWGFCGAWFFLILAPTSSIMPIADLAVEHRMYLPLAALVAACVAGIYLLSSRLLQKLCNTEIQRKTAGRIIGASLLIPALLILVYLTIRRNRDYQSLVSIWTDTISKRSDNARAHCGLGFAYFDLGATLNSQEKFHEAEIHFRDAVRLDPNYTVAHNNLGQALSRQGKLDDAIASYAEALRLDPNYVEANENMGIALSKQDKNEEAIQYFSKTLRLAPQSASARHRLGIVLFNRGKLEEAKEQYLQALRLRPDDPEIHNNLGIVLDRLGNFEASQAEYAEALRLHPNDADVYTNLGVLQYRRRNFTAAAEAFAKASQLKPESVEAARNLEMVRTYLRKD